MKIIYYAAKPEDFGEIPEPCPRRCELDHEHDMYVTLTLNDFNRLEDNQRNGAAMDPAFH